MKTDTIVLLAVGAAVVGTGAFLLYKKYKGGEVPDFSQQPSTLPIVKPTDHSMMQSIWSKRTDPNLVQKKIKTTNSGVDGIDRLLIN